MTAAGEEGMAFRENTTSDLLTLTARRLMD